MRRSLAYIAWAFIGAIVGYAIPVLAALAIVRAGGALGWFDDGSFTDLGIAAVALVFVGPLCAAIGAVLGVRRTKQRSMG